MKMDRAGLLGKLQVIAPAIATKDLIEELTAVWFMDGYAFAYDDLVGIRIELKAEFSGGLRGVMLLGLLEHSYGDDLVCSIGENDEMELKVGNAKLKLALLPEKRSVFEWPKFDKKKAAVLDKDFFQVLQMMLVGVGVDTAVPDQLGVTIRADGSTVDLYSTDSKTISWCVFPTPKGYTTEYAVLPTVFCQQLLRLCPEGGHLQVTNEYAMAENPQGVQLFARLVDVPRPLNFAEIIEEYLDKGPGRAIEVSTRFKLALERSLIVLAGHPGEGLECDMEGDTLRLYAKSGQGELKDLIKFKGAEHDQVVVDIDPTLIKRILPEDSKVLEEYKMRFTKACMLVLGPAKFVHLIAPVAGSRASKS